VECALAGSSAPRRIVQGHVLTKTDDVAVGVPRFELFHAVNAQLRRRDYIGAAA